MTFRGAKYKGTILLCLRELIFGLTIGNESFFACLISCNCICHREMHEPFAFTLTIGYNMHINPMNYTVSYFYVMLRNVLFIAIAACRKRQNEGEP